MKKIIFLISLIYFASYLVAQNEEEGDFSKLALNSADLIDRNIQFQSGSFINGKLNVSEFAGNLCISHALEIGFPNDLKTSLTLTFNANTPHTIMEDILHRRLDNLTFSQFSGITKHPVNAQGWILGINGIAIQTTNFENNFFLGHNCQPNCDPDPIEETNVAYKELFGRSTPLLIPGYHYTNDINWWAYKEEDWPAILDKNANSAEHFFDYIQILKSNGSVVTLSKPAPHYGGYTAAGEPMRNNGFYHIGEYFDDNTTSSGYALVDWASSDPEKQSGYELRRFFYKPGDGLTYFFEEEYVSYGDVSSENKSIWLPRGTYGPRIAYLREIQSPDGDKIVINYTDKNIFGIPDVTNGRKFIHSIEYLDSEGNNNTSAKVDFAYEKNGAGLHFIRITNSITNENFELSLINNNPSADGVNSIDRENYSDFNTNSQYNSKIMNISTIKQTDSKSVDFVYSSIPHLRKYVYLDEFLPIDSNKLYKFLIFKFSYPIYHLEKKEIKNGPAEEITYWLETELDGITPFGSSLNSGYAFYEELLNENLLKEYCTNLYMNQPLIKLDNNKSHQRRIYSNYNIKNMDFAARDNYTKSMVKSIKTRILSNYQKEANYKYYWDKKAYYPNEFIFGEPYEFQLLTNVIYDELAAVTTGIKTEIEIKNLMNSNSEISVPNLIRIIKNYELVNLESPKKTWMNGRYDKHKPLDKEINIIEKSIEIDGNITERETYEYKRGEPGHKVLAYIQSVGDRENEYPGSIYYEGSNILQFHYKNTAYNDNNLVTKKKYKDGILVYETLFDSEYEQRTYQIHYDDYFDDITFGYVKKIETTSGSSSSKDPRLIITESIDQSFIPTSEQITNLSFQFNENRISEITEEIRTVASLKQKSKIYLEYFPEVNNFGRKLRLKKNYGTSNDEYTQNIYSYYETGKIRGFLKSVTSANGVTTEYQYDGEASGFASDNNGGKTKTSIQLSKQQFKPFKVWTKFHAQNVTHEFSTYTVYNGWGQPVVNIDENGYYSRNEYDGIGRVVNKYLPGDFFLINLTTPPTGHSSYQFSYDDELWIPKITERKSQNSFEWNDIISTNYFYPSNNSMISEVAGFKKSKECLNYLNNISSYEDALGRRVYFVYDNFMNLKEQRFGSRQVTATKKVFSINYDNSSDEFGFYKWHKKVEETDELGNKQYNYYDHFGNIVRNIRISETDNCLITQYEYDELNRLFRVTTPEGIATTYAYDIWNNINYKYSPDFGAHHYKYDKFGNLKFEKHASADVIIFYNYDQLNRLISTGRVTGNQAYFNALNPNHGTFLGGAILIENQYDELDYIRIKSEKNYPASYPKPQNLKGRLAATFYRSDINDTHWKGKVYSYDFRGRVKDVFVLK